MVKRAAQVLWPIAMGLWQRSNLCACWSRATLKLIEYSHYSNTFMPFFLMNLSQFDNSTFWVCQIQILVYLVFLNFSGRNFVWWDWADYSSLNELWKNSEAIPLVGKSLGILEELSEQMASAIVIKRWHLQFYSTPDPNYWWILLPSTFPTIKNSNQKSRRLRLLKILWNVRLQILLIE